MKRRDFIVLLGGAAATWPLAARAQQPAMRVIGFIRNTSAAGSASLLAALRSGLNEAGFIEGQNIAIEYRWAEGQSDRLPGLAADLVGRQCAVIIGGGLAATLAAKAATSTIPIVFVTGNDPIQQGLVDSISRPTGNVTGVFFYSLVSKQLELLREVLPKAVVIGMLINPTSLDAEPQIRDAQAAARALGQQLHILHAKSERDFDTAFATVAQKRAGALVIRGNALFFGHRNRLVELAARYAMPVVSDVREYVAAGGLMTYGASIANAYRQTGIYAGRIVKGAKPADLPVEQPTKFELVINLKTAKALGLTIPESFLLRADEVIE
jgi:putative ABC transport system substrate-binding protein